MRIVWLRRALWDIREIEHFIERDDPAAARKMEQRIKIAVSRLAPQPRMGRSGRIVGTRELIVPGTPYTVAYAVRGGRVIILAVLHGSRMWPQAF